MCIYDDRPNFGKNKKEGWFYNLVIHYLHTSWPFLVLCHTKLGSPSSLVQASVVFTHELAALTVCTGIIANTPANTTIATKIVAISVFFIATLISYNYLT